MDRSTRRRAERLAEDVAKRYLPWMDSEEVRDAVIMKCIALVALAYGIPPTPDEPLEPAEYLIAKLERAEEVLARRCRPH